MDERLGLVVKMAGHKMAGRDLLELGFLPAAAFHAFPATGMEAAASRGIHRAGNIPLQNDPVAFALASGWGMAESSALV